MNIEDNIVKLWYFFSWVSNEYILKENKLFFKKNFFVKFSYFPIFSNNLKYIEY